MLQNNYYSGFIKFRPHLVFESVLSLLTCHWLEMGWNFRWTLTRSSALKWYFFDKARDEDALVECERKFRVGAKLFEFFFFRVQTVIMNFQKSMINFSRMFKLWKTFFCEKVVIIIFWLHCAFFSPQIGNFSLNRIYEFNIIIKTLQINLKNQEIQSDFPKIFKQRKKNNFWWDIWYFTDR